MKGRKSVIISIGCAALILTMVMFTQFKTVEYTDIVAIETMRETELRSELANWKEKYDEVQEKLNDTNSKIDEYKRQMSSKEDAQKLLEQELNESEKFVGYTDVKGEGIIITLKDNDFRNIERFDLISLINELKIAGAEAISINDERVVTNTDVALVNNSIILVNSRRISGPYVVKAIGDKKYLESAITIKSGFLDEMEANEKTCKYSVEDNIVINKFNGVIKLDYVKINE